MSDEPKFKISLHSGSGQVSREVEAAFGEDVLFEPADMVPREIVGATIYDATSGEVLAELVIDETGALVQAEPGDAIVGAAFSPEGGRWLRRSEVEGA